MQIVRRELLKILESVSPGLSKKELAEHSNCFMFLEGEVASFNEEIFVRNSCTVPFSGAVPAAPLLAMLGKMPDDKIDVKQFEGKIAIKGKGRRSVIKMIGEAALPVEEIERPDKFEKVPEGLIDALNMCASCCGKRDDYFVLTCVYVGADCVQASDDHQAICCSVKTGIEGNVLIRRESAESICAIGADEWSRSSEWLHFRTKNGPVLSCRCYSDAYPDFRSCMEMKGKNVKLPKQIGESVDRAQVFSSEEGIVQNQIRVMLSEGRLSVKGEGASGFYEERTKMEYSGPDISFLIEPKLLMEIVKRSDSCTISKEKIKVETPQFVYLACMFGDDEEE